jgi:hypothetical protein
MIFNFYIIKKIKFKNFSRPTSLGNGDIDTLFGQNAEFLMLKRVVRIVTTVL